MWNEKSRSRMAQIAKTKRYPSDLTDEEWAQFAPLCLPRGGAGGRARLSSRAARGAKRAASVPDGTPLYLGRSGMLAEPPGFAWRD